MYLLIAFILVFTCSPARLEGPSDAKQDDAVYEYLDSESNQTFENYEYPDSRIVAPDVAASEIDLNNVTELVTESTKEDDEVQKSTLPETNIRNSPQRNGKKLSDRQDHEDCGDPPSIIHAVLLGQRQFRYSAGDKVFYGCEFGYATDEIRRISRGYHSVEYSSECQLSEDNSKLQWTDPTISCSPRSCGSPGFVEHAERKGSLFTFPNKVAFECDEGYKLKGYGIRYCQANGQWSGSLPTCEDVLCDEPSHPEHGHVSYVSLKYGSELQYSCDEGYLLKIQNTRICSDNSTWSGDEPECREAQCDPPTAPDHGSVKVIGERSIVGSMALYTCEGGRNLIGSATSKCLNIGQWTFPTPKCADPCAVPKVENGKIGKYEGYRPRFKELAPGTVIENEEELLLLCEYKYEPLGKTAIEAKISCSNGEWADIPRCEPAKCRTPAPPIEHGRPSKVTRTHGGTVYYSCKSYAEKTAKGNITCNFGTWKGVTPVCKDTHCYIDKLSFPGIVQGGKKTYNSGESFTPFCENGYQPISPGNKLTCHKGNWNGGMPPCTAANCNKKPPEIQHGFAQSYSVFHTSVVVYECDEEFRLEESGRKIVCQFGEWKGTPPTCQDTRCFLRDLRNLVGVSLDTEEVTQSGEFLKTICFDGFYPNEVQPRCVEGLWSETYPSCAEQYCQIFTIPNGQFTVPVQKNFLGFKYQTKFEPVTIGTEQEPGSSSLYISCNNGYYHHGKIHDVVPVRCVRGRWYPSPWCLRRGRPFMEDKIDMRDDSSRIRSRNHIESRRTEATPIVSATTSKPNITIFRDHSADEVALHRIGVKEESNHITSTVDPLGCYCTYKNDNPSVLAFAGAELLSSGSRVRQGCTVDFHCLHFGYQRMQGSPHIVCTDCREWHSAELPECHEPARGDTMFQILGNWTLIPGGYVRVPAGETIDIRCISNNVATYPKWTYNADNNINTLRYKNFTNQEVFVNRLRIINASSQHQGLYSCSLNGYRNNLLELQVESPQVLSCPNLNDGDQFHIHYDKGLAINSSAFFTCKRENQKLIGMSVLTCLSNGKWSGDPPDCAKMCPILQEINGMSISYTNGHEVNSRVSFHCFEPGVRNGVSYTTCRPNGKWADPVPTCDVPFCLVSRLFEVVAEGVYPDMEDAPPEEVAFNSTLKLKCEDNLMLIGSGVARCGNRGNWEVSKVQCVPGCASLKRADSELIVEPDKLFYRFGEVVTLLCPPGQELTIESVRVMCLTNGWSEEKVPSCIAP